MFFGNRNRNEIEEYMITIKMMWDWFKWYEYYEILSSDREGKEMVIYELQVVMFPLLSYESLKKNICSCTCFRAILHSLKSTRNWGLKLIRHQLVL